nr:T9SS type A sorting domain-containing protein [Bacteroidota bacterium]
MRSNYSNSILQKISGVFILILHLLGAISAQNYSSSDSIRFEITTEPGNFLYVDDDNTTGPWTGTIENPFENIPEALTVAEPGFWVVVFPGNYPINQNLTVAADIGLLLFNGDTLQFNETFGLEINGVLKAAGYSNDSIYFTSSSPESSWAGIRFINSQPGSELHHCSIDNSIGGDGDKGSGIYILGSSPKFVHCLIQNNSANYGAGIYCDSLSSPEVISCSFKNNTSNVSGGGLYGIQTDSLILQGNTFSGNVAIGNGGGLALLDANANIQDNHFINNNANDGGGIHLENISVIRVIVSGNVLESNAAQNNGGAISITYSSQFSISGNLFLTNSALNGGAVNFDNAQVDFSNNTIFSNTAGITGGGLSSNNGNNSIFNNIIWGNNSADNTQISGTGLSVNYNDVEGGYPGTGNFSADPLFKSSTIKDFHLTRLSPCIDTGDPLSAPDPDSSTADLGIYYYHHLPPEIIQQPENLTTDADENAVFEIFTSRVKAYQWQESQDHGESWTDLEEASIYSGVTSSQLCIDGVTYSMNQYQYRCVVFGIGEYALISDAAVLYVFPKITIASGSEEVCPGIVDIPITVTDFYQVSAMSLALIYNPTLVEYIGYHNLHDALAGNLLSVNSSGDKVLLSWVSTEAVDIGDANIITFQFNSLLSGEGELVWDTITPGNCELAHPDGHVFKDTYVNSELTVYELPEVTIQPGDLTIDSGEGASFTITANGSGLSYQWQLSTNGGNNWENLLNSWPYYGTNTKFLGIEQATLTMHNYMYRCYINGFCFPSDTSDVATLRVNPVITTIAATSFTCPDTAIVEISTQEFYHVSAFSLALAYDAQVLDYSNYQGLNSSLEAGTLVVHSSQEKVWMSWTSVNPVDVGTGVLLELVFISQGGSSNLAWDDETPGNCEYSDVNGNQILSSFIDGNITVYNSPEITGHPGDKNIITGENTSFSVNATGSGLNYHWQESDDAGSTWHNLTNSPPYSGTTYPTLVLTNVPLSLNENLYRCLVSGYCLPDKYSNPAILFVTPPPNFIHTIAESNPLACQGDVAVPIKVENFENVAAFSLTLGFDTTIFEYDNYQNLNDLLSEGDIVTSALDGKVYISWISTTSVTIGDDTLFDLVFISQTGTCNLIWDVSTPGNCEYSDQNGDIILSSYENGNVTIYPPPVVTAHPVDRTIVEGENTSFSVGATGNGLGYQWQLSTDFGNTWYDLTNSPPYSGANNFTLNISSATLSMNGYLYRCAVSGSCPPVDISGFAGLFVTPPPQVIKTTVGSLLSSCTGNLYFPVMVEDFNHVAAFSLVLTTDPVMLMFDSYQNLHPELADGQLIFNAIDGKVFISWVSLAPVDLGNDTLFELYFISQHGNSNLVWDTLTPGNCEYTNGEGSVILSNYTNGTVSVVPLPLISDAGDNALIEIGESVTLYGNAESGTPPYSFLWSNGETTPFITVSPTITTIYSFTVSDDAGCQAIDFVIVEVLPGHLFDTVQVSFGWSGISSYILPENPAVANIFLPNINDLVILIDDNTNLYWPGQGINTIVNWNSHDGYIIKTSNESEVIFEGSEETGKTINLNTGWNLIPVLSKCNVEVVDLFNQINPVIVKEVAGSGVYWPDYNVNSLIELHSGKAYYVMMNTNASITYFECNQIETIYPELQALQNHHNTEKRCSNERIENFSNMLLYRTPITHTIAIPVSAFNSIDIIEGDFVGAFGEMGDCYGVAVYENKNTTLTLYGNDPTTPLIDGYIESEQICFIHSASATKFQSDLVAEFNHNLPDNNGGFVTNGLSAISKFKCSTEPVEEINKSGIELFPNPTAGKVTILLSGIEGHTTFEISNIHGDLLNNQLILPAVSSRIVKMDLSGYPSGIYIFSFSNTQSTIIKKVVLR